MLNDVTISLDLAQLLGGDIDTRRTRVYVSTNVPNNTLIDTSTGEIRLGDEKVTVETDGTWSFTTWGVGADGNPTSWQTTVTVEYARVGARDRQIRTFGPFTITDADNGKTLAELEDQQAVPPNYQTTFTASMETIRDEAEAARDAAVDISNIDTSDGVVSALVEGTGGAGPLTRSALSASYARRPIIVHQQGLARWAVARGKALFSQQLLVVEGDSITVGANANDNNTSAAADQLLWAQRGFAGQLRDLFAATYGDAGEGWITFGTDEGRWTHTGSVTTSPAGPVSTGRQYSAGGQAAATALGGGRSFTALDVWWYHTTSLSVPRIIVDGTDKTPTVLTSTQDAFAVGASDWANRANATVVNTTVSGSPALQMTASAAANMSAQTPIGTSAIPCTPGTVVAIDFEIVSDAAAAARSARAGAVFFDSGGTQLVSSGELTTLNVTTSPGAAVNIAALVTVPTGAAYMNGIIRVDAPALGEVHRVTRLKLIPLTGRVVGASSVTFCKATVSGLASTDHAVTIKADANRGLFLTGTRLRTALTKGVLVSRVGKSGATAADHAATGFSGGTATNLLTATTDLEPAALRIIALGANDAPGGVTPTDFKARLKILTDKQAAAGGCTLLVAGPRYADPTAQDALYAAAEELATEETHVAYVDLMDLWQDNATANAVGYMNNALLGIHPTAAGHGDYARALHDVLTRPLQVA